MSNYKPPYTITSKILILVSNIVELLTELKHIHQTLDTPKLRKKNRVKSITGTLQIEGNSFTEEKVTGVINGKTVLGTMRELAEVQGAIEAYDYLGKYKYNNEKDLLLSHKFFMSKILQNAGNFRKVNVGVGKHVAPPSKMVGELMGNLFNWLKTTKDHPLIVSSIFHYEFEFIHPFQDGNGRVGRLWQTVILNEYKNIFAYMPIESIIKDNQKKYYDALEQSGKIGQNTPFIEFMLDIIFKTLKKLEIKNNKVGEKVGKKVGENLTENQIEIVKYMMENPKISAKKLSELVNISTRKIEENIKKLKDSKIIKRIGANKGGHWEVSDKT
jgi:Fic family protein